MSHIWQRKISKFRVVRLVENPARSRKRKRNHSLPCLCIYVGIISPLGDISRHKNAEGDDPPGIMWEHPQTGFKCQCVCVCMRWSVRWNTDTNRRRDFDLHGCDHRAQTSQKVTLKQQTRHFEEDITVCNSFSRPDRPKRDFKNYLYVFFLLKE